VLSLRCWRSSGTRVWIHGGHLQFFVNGGIQRAAETAEALDSLGLPRQAAGLREAIARWRSRDRDQPRNAQEFSEACLEGEFRDLDSAYYALEPTVTDALRRYLAEYRDEYIEVIEAS
jgi:hypothetical protein